MHTINYVAGFMFDLEMKRIALIRKCKPGWQKGLLNGIGGKIEEGESPIGSMEREFQEETGYCTKGSWTEYALLHGPDFSVHFFTTKGDIDLLKSMEEEPIIAVDLSLIGVMPQTMVENLPWLIAAAIDFLNDGRPVFIDARYP